MGNSTLPNTEPIGTKSVISMVDIYRDGTRVIRLQSGFSGAKIVVVERPDYQLAVEYSH